MSFGTAAFSEFGFSEQEDDPLDSAEALAFLAEPDAKFCWLLEVDAFSLAATDSLSAAFSDAAFGEVGFSDEADAVTGGEATQYYSTHGYTSQAADSPANTWYDGRLTGEIRIDRSITGRDGVGGLARLYAEVTLVNSDGALDLWTEDYALDGRRARILIGPAGAPRSSYGTIFTGVVQTAPVIGSKSVRLQLSDGIARLEVPVQTTVYAGSGGNEGGADLEGKPKPLCYGYVFNIAPPLVDSTNLIYQVHDGAINDVPAAYDRGVALTKVGGAPSAGQYQVDTTLGTIKLGATPGGTVTCDVKGDASLTGYINKVADIVQRLLVQKAGLSSSEIDSTAFARLNSQAAAEVGIWIGSESRDVAPVVDDLLSGIGAFGGFNRHGAFAVGMVASPRAEPVVAPVDTYTDVDILEVRRVPLPGGVEPVVWRSAVGFQKNYTVQTDLAASVTAARRTFAAAELRLVKSDDSAVKSRHRLARELDGDEGHYAVESDAQAEALRRFNLWSGPPGMFEVDVRPKALTRNLGDVVEVQHRRYGMAAGVPARILGHKSKRTAVTLTVLV